MITDFDYNCFFFLLLLFVCLFDFFVCYCFVLIYRLYRHSYTWQQAENKCLSDGGRLVSINNAAENSFVYHLTTGLGGAYQSGRQRTWIGLGPNYHTRNPKVWLDGSRMTYNFFCPGEPNNRNENCIEMNGRSASRWNDMGCHTRLPQYVCEKCICTSCQ